MNYTRFFGSSMFRRVLPAVVGAGLVPWIGLATLSAVRAADAPGPTPATSQAETAKITVDFKDTTLREAVAKLASLSGNAPLEIGPGLQDKKVTLAAQGLSYWETVDQLAAALDLAYAPTWVSEGGTQVGHLQLSAAGKGTVKATDYTGYAGGVMVKVAGASKLEYLRTPKFVPSQSPDPEGLNLTFTYCWEDRFDPISSEIELTKIQTAPGGDLLPAQAEERRRSGVTSQTIGWSNLKYAPCRDVLFGLSQPAPEVRTIAELSGVVRLETGTGERKVEIANVLDAVGKETKDGDWTIKVVKAEDIGGWMQVDVEIKYKGELQPMPTWWATNDYGWYAQAGARAMSRGSVMTAAGGAGMRKGGPDVTVTGKPGEKTLLFYGDYADNTKLVLKLPKVHETHEFPFTIRGIPLP